MADRERGQLGEAGERHQEGGFRAKPQAERHHWRPPRSHSGRRNGRRKGDHAGHQRELPSAKVSVEGGRRQPKRARHRIRCHQQLLSRQGTILTILPILAEYCKVFPNMSIKIIKIMVAESHR